MRVFPRVVFDTSTLVSAAIRPRSVPSRALTKAFQTCEVCVSSETVEELVAVSFRDKFARYLDLEERREFLASYARRVLLFAVESVGGLVVEPPCRDEKDRKFLELALVCEADLLISSDMDLLSLHPWRGTSIVTPAGFLA